MRAAKQPFIFHSDIQNFKVASKWPFDFFTVQYKILKIIPKRPLIYFINETQKFKNCTQTAICFFTAKYKSLITATERSYVTTETQNFEKLYPTGHLFFPQENKETSCLLVISLKTNF